MFAQRGAGQGMSSPSSKIFEGIVDLNCIVGHDTVGSAFRTSVVGQKLLLRRVKWCDQELKNRVAQCKFVQRCLDDVRWRRGQDTSVVEAEGERISSIAVT